MRRTHHIIILLLLTATLLPTRAQQLTEYNEERPLTIVCDWEFPPYEFINDHGKPDGYNVELMDLLLSRLKIPHKFVMKEWNQAIETFESHEADLIHALSSRYMQRPYVMTNNLIHYYRLKVARRQSDIPLTHLSQLAPGDTVVLKNNDYAPVRILGTYNGEPPFNIEYHSPKEALLGIRAGRYHYFIWGEGPLQKKIKEFALDSLALDDIDIPSGELRIIGYNKELTDLIDDEYARLEQSGDLTKLRDKWFHPERVHNDTSPLALFIIIGAVVIALIAFLLSRLIRSRVMAAVKKSLDINNMMSQAVSMGNFYVTQHDLETNILTNVYGDLLPAEGISASDFMTRIHPDERGSVISIFKNLGAEGSSTEYKALWNMGTAEQPLWRAMHGNSMVEYEDGKPRYIVSSCKDVTHEIEDERQNSELAEKYMKIFETNLVPMSFYGPDGQLIDLNQKMRELCGFDEQGEQFFRQTSLFDVPLFRDFTSGDTSREFHVCQRMLYPEIGIDKYIEYRVQPVTSQKGELLYYSITARDITDERIMYLDQRRHNAEMQKRNEINSNYETQLHYLLENSDMYVWTLNIAERRIIFSRSLRAQEYTWPLEAYLASIATDEERAEARRNLTENVMKGIPFNAIHHFSYTVVSSEPAWHAISGIPAHDADGRLTHYFGVVRDISDLMRAQQKLKQEKARAEDSGRLKSVFLANMTHEIRTPLNAIVGFSDLLPLVDTAEERMEFIRIIRNNCDMLLRLINDILEASSMGQALAIEPTQVDFPQVFDDICKTLEQRVQEPGVEFVKDNPYDHYVTTLDKGRVQQVLTNFTTNAVKYTHQGHIKVGYRQESRPAEGGDVRQGLYFYCEDTGAGIPKEKQASVFERFVKLNDFVQGTGLGLSICKSIAERCGGTIGVTSEGEGHGSTFWMWIPCERL